MTNESENDDSKSPEWDLFAEHMNAAFKTFEQGMDVQSQFVESLSQAVQDSEFEYPDFPGADENMVEESFEGYKAAYKTWMKAAQKMFQSVSGAIADEGELDISEFRDIWLNAANQAFKEIMTTNAFAAMTGQTIDSVLKMKKQTEEATHDMLSEMGFATTRDLDEVATRLVELERRQHTIEDKLDRILENMESS